MTARPDPAPRSPALQVVAVLVAAFFACGTCNSCDQPAPEPPGEAPIAAATSDP